jgi:serine/threonine protein kinase
LDVKPDNIMVDGHYDAQDFLVERVQLIDLENAAHLPDGRCIKGMLAGNANWRSPEAHLKGELNKPADIFSFGTVVSAFLCLYGSIAKDYISASMLCWDRLSSVQTRTSRIMKRRVHCPH